MRSPRDKRSFDEFQTIKQLKSSERTVEEIDLEGDLRVALIFPNTYEVASSSLGFNLVWKLFNRLHRVRCERFFIQRGFQKFYSLDSLTPLDEFSIWAFAMNFENDLMNVLWLLNKKGIPLFNTERRRFDPLIIFGGALTYTDLPIFKTIADVVLHGDFEAMLQDLDEVFVCQDREKILEKISQIDFATVPTRRKTATKNAFFQDINLLVPMNPVISTKGEFSDRMLIEIERGCLWNCSFCMMGALKKPVRFVEPQVLKNMLQNFRFVGLIASNVTDYPWLDQLLPWFEEKKIKVSFSSLRLDRLNERFLKFLRLNQQSLTIAPESFNEKIRMKLEKRFTNQQIEDALLLGKKVGFDSIKLYMIYGFEEETEEDFKQISEYAKQMKKMGYKQVKFSFNPLVPKRGTKMQSSRMQDIDLLKKKARIIKKFIGENAKVVFEDIGSSYIQFLINSATESNSFELLRKLSEYAIFGEYRSTKSLLDQVL
ncbi:B12-binding domain-containing radical SAM protein [Pseudothermotoga sp. U03pept]|uniref:B12-binding domain-containing radical SAM protein n=1 Tax=Pseudothermotoga sp. U03pept TaxID=3447012 RepID=UPI003F00563A